MITFCKSDNNNIMFQVLNLQQPFIPAKRSINQFVFVCLFKWHTVIDKCDRHLRIREQRLISQSRPPIAKLITQLGRMWDGQSIHRIACYSDESFSFAVLPLFLRCPRSASPSCSPLDELFDKCFRRASTAALRIAILGSNCRWFAI